VIVRVISAAAVLWALALPAAAYAATQPAGSAVWHAFGVAVYSLGSAICHQRPERSFHLFGAQLPVCARCVGIYAGAALIAVAFPVVSAFGRTARVRLRPDTTAVRWLLAAALLPAALSLVYEWTTGDVPSNAIRAATGVVLGGASTLVILQQTGI
jgi:uncharacterized membrane protein